MDYGAAYRARAIDTEALHNKTPIKRHVGAMHFGGITIECILNELIFAQHGIKKWGQKSKRDGKVIKRPIKHDLLSTANMVIGLKAKIEANEDLRKDFDTIQKPLTVKGKVVYYISARYIGAKVPQEKYDEWYQAYNSVKDWLIKNKRIIVNT